ncbi:MAG: alpha-galactosidase, partial [Erysipelotrichaceae bacterium]|nr:alpha-galactosidase [Erysipelotrichaceae bacterium]
GKIIDKTKASYIKWDMNRQLLGVDRNFNHRYILALYDVLKRIFEKRPEVLLESCSSGGNRFDLGMACFSPQIWTSDDTDPLERMTTQKNASYLYPLSMMGAHVAASPSAQTLRRTSLPLRFNVAAFGDLGYELDLRKLSKEEKQEISRQIAFYKAHRPLFQFGSFRRYSPDAQRETFAVSNGTTAIAAVYRRHLRAAPGFEKLAVRSLPEGTYEISSVEQHFAGENYGLPVSDLITPKERYLATDKGLAEGIVLNNVYTAAGYNPDVRVPLDDGSEMYLISRLEKEE